MNKRLLLNIFVIFSFTFFPSIVSAATYYVSASGSDSNSGTSTTATWQTITKVNAATLQPGDFVLFKSGDIFAGKLVPGQNGTSGNPITYSSYGSGAKPIIDGSGQTRGLDIRTRNYLVYDNLEIKNSSQESIFLFNGDSNIEFKNLILRGSTASVNFNSGFYSNISLANIQAFDYGTYGINLSASSTNVTIDNFTGTASSTTATTTAIAINIAGTTVHSNTIIRNSNLSNQRYGILRSPTNTMMTNFTISTTTASNNATIGMFIQGGGSGYYFNNLTLDNNGVSTTTGGGGGITINANLATSDVHLDTIYTRNNYGPGVKMYANISNVDLNNVTSTGNKDLVVRSAGGIGMLFASASTSTSPITVRNSTLTDNENNGFRSEPNTESTVPIIVTNTESSRNLNDGFSADGWANVTCDKCIAINNGIDGIGANGDGFSWHASSTGVIKNSFASNNKKSNITHVHNTSVNMFNNILHHTTSGTLGGVFSSGTHIFNNNLVISDANEKDGLTIGTSTLNNNIVYGFDYGFADSGGAISDFNSFYNNSSGVYRCKTDSSNCFNIGSHSLTSNPLFTNIGSQDYKLTELSPLIDAGTAIAGRTSDRDGNPIYGAADIGPYEYQPPYTIGATAINTDGGVRIYADGKFRYTNKSLTQNNTQLSVTPLGGAYMSGNYAEYLDISNISLGADTKQWTASSSIATSTVFTLNGLKSNVNYDIKVDSSLLTTVKSDGLGSITFTYSGGWSTHSFSVEPVIVGPTGGSGGGSFYSVPSIPSPTVVTPIATTSTAIPAFVFSRDLKQGITHTDVRLLQQYLNAHGFQVAKVGAGSVGKETAFFGPATRAAVVKFQKAKGITPAVGYFGIITRTYINSGK